VTGLLHDLVRARGIVIGDGGIGTMLQEAGLAGGEVPEVWNVERPADVTAIHRAYAQAGAAYLTTNTFGGSAPRLAMHGLEDRVHELNRAGARVAREAVGDSGALVAGSVGPTGELLEPLGVLTADEARAHFAEQVRGLADGGADMIVIETLSDLGEIQAAVAGARDAAPGLPVMATMSFDVHLHTMMGVSPRQAVRELAAIGVDAAGANCGRGLDEMLSVMREMVENRPGSMLLASQSNAGLPRFVGGEMRYDATPQDMAAHALRMRDLGVQIVGACCGSTPDHIASMRDALLADSG
jgi:5-methyltetrahydrofolate--homocysteine methyltransferase